MRDWCSCASSVSVSLAFLTPSQLDITHWIPEPSTLQFQTPDSWNCKYPTGYFGKFKEMKLIFIAKFVLVCLFLHIPGMIPLFASIRTPYYVPSIFFSRHGRGQNLRKERNKHERLPQSSDSTVWSSHDAPQLFINSHYSVQRTFKSSRQHYCTIQSLWMYQSHMLPHVSVLQHHQ